MLLSKPRLATKVYQQEPYLDRSKYKIGIHLGNLVCSSTSLNMKLYLPALLFADLCDLKIFLKMFLKSPNRAEDAGFFLAPLTKHMDKLFQNWIQSTSVKSSITSHIRQRKNLTTQENCILTSECTQVKYVF